MRKLATSLTWVAVLSSVAACSDVLDVKNENSPDVARAYSSPTVIAQIIATGLKQIHQGIHGSSTSLTPQLMSFASETYGTVANFGMNVRGQLPRGPISNERNNITFGENVRDFSSMQQRARDYANIVQSLDALLKVDITRGLGQPGTDNTGLNLANRSFAIFSNGLALAYVALAYDSAAIITHTSKPATEATPPLSGYADVMKAALAEFDTALAVANDPRAAGGFPLVSNSGTYFNGMNVTQADFVRIIRSYKARFRAGVARSKAERDAADWNAIIADATNGITSDLILQMGNGWSISYEGAQMFQDDSRGWHQFPMMYAGMADTSGSYNAWLATPLGNRAAFVVKTADKRWPSGNDRPSQQASNQPATGWTYSNYPWIRNRTGQDTPGEAYGNSQYDFYRFKGINLASGVGPWIEMPKAEIDMLAAEGYIRKGDFASAAALINKTRTKVGLPTIGTITSATQPIASGACTPMVPNSAGNAASCGNIMEAMKYEKRMETAYTGYATWYFDARGWGDLPEGTALQFPVPYQEMDARQKLFYNLGGLGGQSSAGKGTYGF